MNVKDRQENPTPLGTFTTWKGCESKRPGHMSPCLSAQIDAHCGLNFLDAIDELTDNPILHLFQNEFHNMHEGYSAQNAFFTTLTVAAENTDKAREACDRYLQSVGLYMLKHDMPFEKIEQIDLFFTPFEADLAAYLKARLEQCPVPVNIEVRPEL